MVGHIIDLLPVFMSLGRSWCSHINYLESFLHVDTLS
jgi:hypothetical protein